MTRGTLVGYGGAIWIESVGERSKQTTEPGWIGPLKFWKARRYAKRNGITLVSCNCGLTNGHRNPRACPVHGPAKATRSITIPFPDRRVGA